MVTNFSHGFTIYREKINQVTREQARVCSNKKMNQV